MNARTRVENADTVSLVCALLVRFPELASIRSMPARPHRPAHLRVAPASRPQPLRRALAEAIEDHIRSFLSLFREEPETLRFEWEGDRSMTFVHITRDLESFTKEELELQVGVLRPALRRRAGTKSAARRSRRCRSGSARRSGLCARRGAARPRPVQESGGVSRREARARLLLKVAEESQGVGAPIAIPAVHVLLIGDVVGSPGRETLKRCLSLAREQHQVSRLYGQRRERRGRFRLDRPDGRRNV